MFFNVEVINRIVNYNYFKELMNENILCLFNKGHAK
jgi:hypothetical protein